MSGPSRPIADGELAEVIEARAQRAKVDPALIGRVAAEAAASRQQQLGWWQSALRSFAPARRTAASIVAVLAVVSVVGAGLFVGGGTRPAESPSTSPSASGLVSGPTQETTAYRFTSVDFLRYLREQPDAFVGHTVLVDGSLAGVQAPCVRASFDCPPMSFGSARDGDPPVIPSGQAARRSVGDAASGTFAITVASPTTLRLVRQVELSPSNEAFKPSEIRTTKTTGPRAYAVDGYLNRARGTYFCPFQNRPAWCPPAWLSDARESVPNAPSGLPEDAIQVPADASSSLGLKDLPARGTFLVQPTSMPGCGAGELVASSDCPVWSTWTIVGRVEPVIVSEPVAPSAAAGNESPVVLGEAELGSALERGGLSAGQTVLVQATLLNANRRGCGGPPCPVAIFSTLGQAVGVAAGGDMPAFPISGTFAIRVIDRTDVRYLARIVPNGNHASWTPLALARYGPPPGSDLYAVTGWLVRGNPVGCDAHPGVAPACDGPPQIVEDEAAAQALLSGQKVESLLFASVFRDIAVADPQAGTFLVRASTDACNDITGGPIPDCFVPAHPRVTLHIDARVDPIAHQATPRSTLSAPPTDALTSPTAYLPGGIVRAVDGEPVLYGLDTQIAIEDSTDATPFLIGGWFDSHFLATCSGAVGQDDPNPLGRHSCAWILLDGGPRDLYFPPDLVLPDGDAPIVLRVHTHDPSADTCLEVDQAFCRSRPVIDDVIWFGDAQTRGQPTGPAEARRRIESLPIAPAHQFVTPHICANPDERGWPADLFAIHGDPRLGLLAVFPSAQAAADFAGDHPPASGVACIGAPDVVVWAGEPGWIAHDNVLVLSFGDDMFDRAVADALNDSNPPRPTIGPADPDLDLAGNIVWDYVEGRAFGTIDSDSGYRLVSPQDRLLDVDRRARATALFGTIARADGPVTEQRVGSAVWKQIQGTTGWRLFIVHYPGSTDPALADETFVAAHVPKSTFTEWELFRVGGAGYPPRP